MLGGVGAGAGNRPGYPIFLTATECNKSLIKG